MNARKKRDVYAAAVAIAQVNPGVNVWKLGDALGVPYDKANALLVRLEDEGIIPTAPATLLGHRFARAVFIGSPAAVKACLEQGFEVNRPFTDRYGDTDIPLLYACRWGSEKQSAAIVQLLLAAGADPNACCADGDNALAHADNAPLIRHLLNAGADATQLVSHGQSVLHSPGRFIDTDSLRLLLAAGARADVIDDEGNSPLFSDSTRLAARPERLALLLKAGAPMEHRNKQGLTALDCALTRRRLYPYALALLRHGARPTATSFDCLLSDDIATAPEKQEVMNALLSSYRRHTA